MTKVFDLRDAFHRKAIRWRTSPSVAWEPPKIVKFSWLPVFKNFKIYPFLLSRLNENHEAMQCSALTRTTPVEPADRLLGDACCPPNT
jgi:hypothetical protein